ncbi:MAG TPA: chemotaxis protein CheD [Thermoguttaceae bacterium]|nr:chemotaxis protein CheD [Thermoguttaceae bacterium]
MSSCIARQIAGETMVGMGQATAGRAPERMKAILGSCVAVALYHPRLRAGVVAHVVLPDSAGRNGVPGKFADTAVPHMLTLLKQMGVPSHGLTAKLTGGANMFDSTGPLKIGDANVEAVTRELTRAGIRVAARDVGGTKGRRMSFDCSNGQITIENAGLPPRIL